MFPVVMGLLTTATYLDFKRAGRVYNAAGMRSLFAAYGTGVLLGLPLALKVASLGASALFPPLWPLVAAAALSYGISLGFHLVARAQAASAGAPRSDGSTDGAGSAVETVLAVLGGASLSGILGFFLGSRMARPKEERYTGEAAGYGLFLLLKGGHDVAQGIVAGLVGAVILGVIGGVVTFLLI